MQVAAPRSTYSHQPYASGPRLHQPSGPARHSYQLPSPLSSRLPFQFTTAEAASVPYQLTWYDHQSITSLHNSINKLHNTIAYATRLKIAGKGFAPELAPVSAERDETHHGQRSQFSETAQSRSALVPIPRILGQEQSSPDRQEHSSVRHINQSETRIGSDVRVESQSNGSPEVAIRTIHSGFAATEGERRRSQGSPDNSGTSHASDSRSSVIPSTRIHLSGMADGQQDGRHRGVESRLCPQSRQHDDRALVASHEVVGSGPVPGPILRRPHTQQVDGRQHVGRVSEKQFEQTRLSTTLRFPFVKACRG